MIDFAKYFSVIQFCLCGLFTIAFTLEGGNVESLIWGGATMFVSLLIMVFMNLLASIAGSVQNGKEL